MSSLMNIKDMYSRASEDFKANHTKVTQNRVVGPQEQFAVRRDLIAMYLSWTAVVSKVDPDILEAQSTIVYDNTPSFERKISINVAEDVASNFGLFTLALDSNYLNARDVMASFIEQEIKLDELDAAKRAEMRKGMNLKSGEPIPFDDSCIDLEKHDMTYDMSCKLLDMLSSSFLMYSSTNIESAHEKIVDSMTDEDFEIVGIILSNYFYILRALNYNPKCLVTFVDMINRCKQHFS